MNTANINLAIQVRDLLQQRNARLVTAESCTAGRIAATLSSLPGVSQWLCGGFVVYRSGSKNAWLGIPWDVLNDPQYGPVSQLASDLLCVAALEKTPEATWSLAITGDVGPGAPASTDGHCFVSVKLSRDAKIVNKTLLLRSPPPENAGDIAARVARLDEATGQAFKFLLEQSASLA
ncbi:MAG: CinA family protein [Pirellulales bacterium]